MFFPARLYRLQLIAFSLLLCQVNSVQAAVTANAERTDPLVGFHFALEIEGKVEGYFTGFSGIGSESEVIIQADQKIPGKLIFHDVTLSRGITSNLYLWTWRKQVEDGDVLGARRDFTIIMYDQQATELKRWQFFSGWPAKIQSPKGSATADINTASEEITIVHQGGYLQQPTDGACGQIGDGDADGVCNDTDNCPVIVNPAQTDSDGDGTGDDCEICFNDSNKTDPGICGCGIADIDSTGDGVMDCIDSNDVANLDLVPNSDDVPNKSGVFSVNVMTLFAILLLTIMVRRSNKYKN